MVNEKSTRLNAALLAGAFPLAVRSQAVAAGRAARWHLLETQRWSSFSVVVGGETVLIPHRLYYSGGEFFERSAKGDPWLMMRSLRTRSADGFERQRAVRNILAEIRPWSAPFVIALIGEYVIEILDEIEAAMSPTVSESLVVFIVANPSYWYKTKQRVFSYWYIYYRLEHTRTDYVGFRLVDHLEAGIKSLYRQRID